MNTELSSKPAYIRGEHRFANGMCCSMPAAVLAYIASLLLRTRSAIDHDREAQIKDPTASKRTVAPIPDLDPTKKPS